MLPSLQYVSLTSRLVLCAASPRDSLSELREYTEGLGEPTEADDCASPSCQSVISLLSSEELKKLIEEVKVLDEATLKVGLRQTLPRTKAGLCSVVTSSGQRGGHLRSAGSWRLEKAAGRATPAQGGPACDRGECVTVSQGDRLREGSCHS